MKTVLFLTYAAVLSANAVTAATVEYRNPENGNEWAVVTDPAAPFVWIWAEGATAATVTASNILTRTVSSVSVARGEGLDGSCTIPFQVEGLQLVDVTLSQSDGTSVIDEKTVRLAVGSHDTVYTDKSDKGFSMLGDPRVYSWSDEWADGSSGAEGAVLATSIKDGAAIKTASLPSISGFAVMSAKDDFNNSQSPVVATLSFDGTIYWTCELGIKLPGLFMFFK